MTLAELRHYRDKAARIVTEHGDVFAPVLHRLEREVSVRESLAKRAASYETRNETRIGTQTRHHEPSVNTQF